MMTAPIFNNEGRIVYILAGALNILQSGSVFHGLATKKVGNSGYFFIFAKDKTLIMHPDPTRIMKKDVMLGENKLFDQAISGWEGSGETVNSLGIHSISSFKRITAAEWVLAVNQPEEEALQAVYNFRRYFLYATSVALIMALMGTLVLARSLTSPLNNLIKSIARIDPRNLTRDQFVSIRTGDEITQLAASFNALMDEIIIANSNLIESRKAAEAANHAKSAFLANMSHEIRTPLNGVLGMLQLIQTSEDLAEVEMYAEMGIRAGQRLTSLLGDILDLSRIEAGRMPIASNPFALADVFTALTETFSPVNYSKGLPLVIRPSPDIPTDVIGDDVRVRQILFNLVGNAMKFTDQGEVVVEVSTLLPHPSGMARLLFIISDTGIGIPDEKIDQICAPFTQVSEDFTRSHQGAGLGLAIALKLIDAMGGTLAFDSTEGQGTSVYLVLPFSIPEQSAIPLTATPGPKLGKGAMQ